MTQALVGKAQHKKMSKGAKAAIGGGVVLGLGALLLSRRSAAGGAGGGDAAPLAAEGDTGPNGALFGSGGGVSAGVDPCQAAGLTGTYPNCDWTSGGGGTTPAGTSPAGGSPYAAPPPTGGGGCFTLNDAVNGLLIGSIVVPPVYKGAKKYFSKTATPTEGEVQTKRTVPEEGPGSLGGRRTDTFADVADVPVEVRTQSRDAFARSSRTRAVAEGPEYAGSFSRGTIAAGAAFEGVNALVALPGAIDASRRLQQQGYSNASASGLATAAAFGGFQANQENIDLARRNPALAVLQLSGEGFSTIAQGGLNNNQDEVRYAQTHGFIPSVGHAVGTEVVGIGTGVYQGAGYVGQGVASAATSFWDWLW